MLGLYVHIPFCKTKCNYCNFNSYICDEFIVDKYITAFINEIKLFKINYPLINKPDTVFIGGGTPSVLSDRQIERILSGISENFNLDCVVEFTVECNPESINENKINVFKNFGVNRISIGLQSFNDKYLKYLGRIHTVKDFIISYETARKSKFGNINVDLIFGIPGQTESEWRNDLEKTMEISPEHISAYALSIEEGSKFYNNSIKIDDDLQAEMYKTAIDYLTKMGFIHYEISNFAKKPCVHNQIYWKNEPYVGLGAGAVSYIDGRRIKNVGNPLQYVTLLEREMLPVLSVEELHGKRKIAEKIILGLRMIEGIELKEDEKEFEKIFLDLKQKGLVDCINNRWRLTRKGILLANFVFREIIV